MKGEQIQMTTSKQQLAKIVCTTRARYYVGLSATEPGARKVFSTRSRAVPTPSTHGHLYSAVIGPFRTKRGALVMARYGRNNPHLQTVADAEKLAAEYARAGTCLILNGYGG